MKRFGFGLFVRHDRGSSSWYGVRIDESNSSPDLTRIASSVGDMTLHATLPVHSLIKACTLLDNGTVNYYLKPTDWTKKADGSASNLDGSDGQIMIEWPDFYYQVVNVSAGVWDLRISQNPVIGFTLVPKHYISAYQATLSRSTLKLSSVKNTATDYRGGDNDAGKDAAYNTFLGVPVSNISRTNARIYARNRGVSFNGYGYADYKWLTWFFVIEYATLNSQKAVDGTLTAEGYKKGGLGAGVTAVSGWDYEPFIPCGASDSLASGTGEVTHTIAGWPGGSQDFKVPRYRGHENPFGHIHQNVDGVNADVKTAGDGGTSKIYTNDNPLQYNDLNNEGFTYKADFVRTSNWINKLMIGSEADIIPTVVAATGATIYHCDKNSTSVTASSLRAVRVGGSGDSGTSGGLFYHYTSLAVTTGAVSIGGRLSCTPLSISKAINDKWGVIGDSTVAKYLEYLPIAEFLGNNTDLTSIATAGDKISDQATKWDALNGAVKSALKYVFIMVGLNDCAEYGTAVGTNITQLQNLINNIASDSPNAKIVLCTMTPAKQRFIDLLGAVNGATAYQKWLDLNTAITGGGGTPITGADAVISSHTTSLNDGSGNLSAAYNFKDNVHENNPARQLIANLWIAQL